MPTGVYKRKLTRIILKCASCKQEFNVTESRSKVAKYCSFKCYPGKFKQGHIPSHKGKKLGPNPAHSERMKGRTAWNKGLPAPWAKKEKSHFWKGDRIKYSGIHMWLRAEYGVASECESEFIDMECRKNSNRYHWAKLHDKNYERNRENFIQLCNSCHRRYDQQGQPMPWM